MKTALTGQQVIDALLQTLTGLMGTPESEPDAQAKVSRGTGSPSKKVSRKRVVESDSDDTDDTDESEYFYSHTFTEGDAETRWRLPRVMYQGKENISIDGVKYPQTADQGRSGKFNISVFDAEAGDTINFTFVKKSGSSAYYDYEVESAPRGKNRRSGKVQASTKKAEKVPAKVEKPKAGSSKKVARPDSANETWESILAQTAKTAIRNANKGYTNKNIVNQGLFPVDARIYLNSEQNTLFRKGWKHIKGIKLGKAVTLLNAEVFDDED